LRPTFTNTSYSNAIPTYSNEGYAFDTGQTPYVDNSTYATLIEHAPTSGGAINCWAQIVYRGFSGWGNSTIGADMKISLGGTLQGVTWYNSLLEQNVQTNANVVIECSLDGGSTWPYSQTISANGSDTDISSYIANPVTFSSLNILSSTWDIRVRLTTNTNRAGNSTDGYHSVGSTIYIYDVVMLCKN